MSRPETPRPARRPRYRGTHPRRFDERYKERNPDQYPGMGEHIRAQGRTPAGSHVPVMLDEVIDVLDLAPGQVVADATVGHGGHAAALLERIGSHGSLVAVDHDDAELERTRQRFQKEHPGAPVKFVRSHFAGLGRVQTDFAPRGFDAILVDLGVSSMQLDDP
ncbi:MAG: S-adenosyl-methyltransferase MraW, partial [bacterium]